MPIPDESDSFDDFTYDASPTRRPDRLTSPPPTALSPRDRGRTSGGFFTFGRKRLDTLFDHH